MNESHVPLPARQALCDEAMLEKAVAMNAEMQGRRSVRDFDGRAVPRSIIEACLTIAGSAPSGAHQQPWHFVAVSDPAVKRRIRSAAEAEEREFYGHRAPQEWLAALAPLGTDSNKLFLETAPWLIAIFLKRFARRDDGQKVKHYYTDESVGIACGFLIAALHHCGLATLTHTPSPMGFLSEILGRPKDLERPFLLLVVGHPAPQARVPDLVRKPLNDIATVMEGTLPL